MFVCVYAVFFIICPSLAQLKLPPDILCIKAIMKGIALLTSFPVRLSSVYRRAIDLLT